MLVGPDDFVRRLKALGFLDLNEGDYYGLSMALGSVDVSLYELTKRLPGTPQMAEDGAVHR